MKEDLIRITNINIPTDVYLYDRSKFIIKLNRDEFKTINVYKIGHRGNGRIEELVASFPRAHYNFTDTKCLES